jgi:hypothetical protein
MTAARLALAISLLVFAGCASGPRTGPASVPGRGAITVEVEPNPIVATQVSGNMYEFPFHVIVRESGGRAVNVTRVSATVKGMGGLTFARESWDANQIRAMGYATSVGANGELRYRFAPRREVPDVRLFGGVSAQLTVEGTDDLAAPASASTVVTVTR